MVNAKRAWWVPVKTYTETFVRVEAYSAEEAVGMVDEGNFTMEQLVAMDPDHIERYGAPQIEEIS